MIARAAKMQIDSHERICAERYEEIRRNQTDARSERVQMHRDNKELLSHVSGRVDRLYSRAWTIAGTIIGTEAMIIVGIIAYVMKRVMEGNP